MSDRYAFRDLLLKLKVNTKNPRKTYFKFCGNMIGSILTRQRKKILAFQIE